jgi:branched-chain amino acid transport system permease protein
VRSLGKNVFAYKMQSLALGGVMGAIGGIIITLNFTSVIPDYFIPTVTFFAYAVVILGGAGSVWGPLVGSVIFWFVIQFSESSLDATVPEDILSSQDLAALRFVLVGVLLMALMVFRPQGLLGKKEELLADG